MPISKNAKLLLKERYCINGETPKEVFKRVAESLSLGDEKFETRLYKAMSNGYILPNSPCLMNAGKKKGMLHACFTLKIEDDMRSIFETVTNTAEIFKYGGGCGINFSNLRPKGQKLSNGGTSSGAVSFMGIFNIITETVKQGGRRRGALMGILDYNHPEILDFITSKLQNVLNNFNISIMITDEFMQKVENGEKITLRFGNELWGTTDAKNLFDIICFSAWKSGDPGVLFFDRINKDNPLYPKVIINTVNPCSEVALPVYSACCLGSINISKFVRKNKFDFKSFADYVALTTRMLLTMNEKSWYPLPQITKQMKELNPIGVGIMGFADALIKLGIYYNSEECLSFIEKVGKVYKKITDNKAKKSFYKRIIAPTGSLSILADCSASIEPVFERAFRRHLTVGVIEEVRELYKSKYCRTAMEISPEWHLKVQAKWQEQLDGGLSKTINLPNNATVDDIKKIYFDAWKLGTKGVTVFRNGCKEGVFEKVKCDGGECHL